MPKFSRETLLKWYESFTQQAQQHGIDLNTVVGRLSVRGVYNVSEFDEEDPSIDFFAYAPTNGEGVYNNPVPFAEDSEDIYDQTYHLSNLKSTFIQDSQKLESNSKSSFSTELREDVNKLDKTLKEYSQLSIEQHNRIEDSYKPYDKWLVDNLTPIDTQSEEDLERIEKMYTLASEGKLFLMPHTTLPNSAVQLYVNENGTCGATKAFSEYDSKGIDALTGTSPIIMRSEETDIYIKEPATRAKYEELYNVTLHDPATPEEEALFRERMLKGTFPDIPEGSRGPLADSFFDSNVIMVRNHYALNRAITEAQHLQDIIKRSDRYNDYLEKITASPETDTKLRSEFNAEAIDALKTEAASMTERFNAVSAPILQAEAAENAKLKAWYNSFAEEVKKLGGDLSNPANLMNVNIFFETNDREAPLTDRFAFAPMDSRGRYKEPEPIVSEEACEKLKRKISDDGALCTQTEAEYTKAADLISRNKLDEAREAAAMGDYYRGKAAEAMNERHSEQFAVNAKRDAWLIRNLKPINPDDPADIDRIRIMYNQAAKGLLSYGQAFGSDEIRQVNVSDDGSCKIGIAIKETPKNLDITWEQLTGDKNAILDAASLQLLFSNHPEIKQKYEETFGEKIIDKMEVPKVPKDLVKPEQPPKPGVWSAIKWFFSAGRANSDYEAYNSYPARLEEYNTRRRALEDRILDATRNNARARDQWNRVISNIGKFRHPDAPDKTALLDTNFYFMFQHLTQIGSHTIQPLSSLPFINVHMAKLWDVAKNNPGILTAKNINTNGDFVEPDEFKALDESFVTTNLDELSSRYSRKILQAQITQEISRMNLAFDLKETSENVQTLGYRMESIMPPCSMLDPVAPSSDQLVTSVESGNLDEITAITPNSKLASAISAFGDPQDYETGLATFVGILSNADKNSFASLVDYTLMAGKEPNRLNDKYPDQMKHLRNVTKEFICDPNGNIDNAKYADALKSVIDKCTANIFKKDGAGLNAERIAMCCVASRLTDKLDELGRGDLITEDARKQLNIVKQIPFVVNVATAGTAVMAPLAENGFTSPEQRREDAAMLIQQYGKTMSAIMLYGALDNIFQGKDFSHLALIKDTPSTLAAMKGFEKKVKATDPLDFTNLHDPEIRNRLAANILSGKSAGGKSLDADEPVRFSDNPKIS